MQVTIQKIDDTTTPPRVYIKSDIGSLWAAWAGDLPTLNATYHVELQSDDMVVWGEEITAAPNTPTAIREQEDGIVLVGLLEAVEGDGTAVVRVGSSIMMLETFGDNTLSPQSMVEVKLTSLTLYDTNI